MTCNLCVNFPTASCSLTDRYECKGKGNEVTDLSSNFRKSTLNYHRLQSYCTLCKSGHSMGGFVAFPWQRSSTLGHIPILWFWIVILFSSNQPEFDTCEYDRPLHSLTRKNMFIPLLPVLRLLLLHQSLRKSFMKLKSAPWGCLWRFCSAQAKVSWSSSSCKFEKSRWL